MSQNDQIFMRQALALAEHAKSQGEVPVGAVLVSNGEIIGRGWNSPISSADPTAHAEIIALRQAAQQINNYRLVNSTLYVTLEPCIMCIGAMLHARIARLVFGAYDPRTGAVTSVFNLLDATTHNHRIAYSGGILSDVCGDLLRDFFKQRR